MLSWHAFREWSISQNVLSWPLSSRYRLYLLLNHVRIKWSYGFQNAAWKIESYSIWKHAESNVGIALLISQASLQKYAALIHLHSFSFHPRYLYLKHDSGYPWACAIKATNGITSKGGNRAVSVECLCHAGSFRRNSINLTFSGRSWQSHWNEWDVVGGRHGPDPDMSIDEIRADPLQS